MKTRCLDHIDLRVKDMQVARNFYGKFLPQLGFVHESPGEDFHTFYAAVVKGHGNFLVSPRIRTISQTARASRSGQIHAKK